MALVIENGQVVANANSYVEVSELRAYATARGVTLPVADADVEKFLIKAADYLGSFEQQYRGVRQSEAQELSWPRAGAFVNGFEVADDAIPKLLKKAQMQAAVEIFNGFDPLTSTDGRFVKREKVDVIETEFATPQELAGEVSSTVELPAVASLLQPLLRDGGALRSVRV